MKAILGIILGLVLVSSVFTSNAIPLAYGRFEDCGVWEDIYESEIVATNNDFELRFGEKEVSQRVADHATSGGMITWGFMTINEMAANILGNCGSTERSLTEVHGKLNQNIIDSLKMYKNMSVKDVGLPYKESKAQTKSSTEVKKDAKKDTKKKTTDTKKKAKEVKKTVKSETKKKVETKTAMKKKMSLDDCTIREMIYRENVATTNIDDKNRFGMEEISQRIADHFTSGGMVTDSIVTANRAGKELVDNCFYSEKSLVKVLGGFNQNIIDSVKQYKNMKIQDIK